MRRLPRDDQRLTVRRPAPAPGAGGRRTGCRGPARSPRRSFRRGPRRSGGRRPGPARPPRRPSRRGRLGAVERLEDRRGEVLRPRCRRPRSSTSSATASCSGSARARTTIGVPGSLYLPAFSRRLSSNWPRSGRCARVQAGSPTAASKRRVVRPVVAGPARGGGRRPRRTRSRPLEVGQPRLGVGAGEEQQHLDDPPEPLGVVAEPVEDALVLLGRARATAGHLDRGDQGGQRRPELVRRLAGEPPLPLHRHVEAVEQAVEAPREVLQLVARAGAGQPAVVGGHRAGRLGHERQRRERPPGEVPADRRGQRPEAQRDQGQDGRQPADLGLHRPEARPTRRST